MVDLSASDKVVDNTQDQDKSENCAGPVRDSEVQEASSRSRHSKVLGTDQFISVAVVPWNRGNNLNNGGSQHVEQSDDIERGAPAPERPTSRWQGITIAATPKNTADAQGVSQSQGSGEQANNRVEDSSAAQIEDRNGDADAQRARIEFAGRRAPSTTLMRMNQSENGRLLCLVSAKTF